MKAVERIQTGARIEKRMLKVLKGLAEYLDVSLGDLIEGIVLHAFEGKAPFGCNCARLDLNVHGMLSIFAAPRFSAQVEYRRQSRLPKS